MSYILDALKKAEKERKQGTLPDMLTVQDIVAEKPAKRFAGLYLLVAALVLNAAILVWWLGFSHSSKTKVSQIATAGNTSTLSVNETVQTVSEVPTSPAPVQAISTETRPVEKNIVPVTGRPVSGNPDTKPDRPREIPVVPVVQSKLVTDRPVSGSDIPKPAEISTEKVNQADAAGLLPSVPANGFAGMPEENKIYKLMELPSSIRQSLPSFSVSALLYSSSPASRMVRINDQMMHEGQDLAAGVKLEEITRDGLIFRYQKYRFFVATKQF
jgi:general secretion pathway protein B